MQSVLGLAVVLSTVILLSLMGVVVPASDGWPPPAADPASTDGGLEEAATAVELTGEGHSPAVDDDGPQGGLLRRRRRRRQKHHHRQQHDSKVYTRLYMH